MPRRLMTWDGQTIREGPRLIADNWGPRLAFSPESPVCAVSFSPDGQSLAAGDSDGEVRFWKVARQSEPDTLLEPDGRPTLASSAGEEDKDEAGEPMGGVASLGIAISSDGKT